MKKVKLSLLEVHGLNIELVGFTNQGTLEKLQKGLLDEKLYIVTKYKLSDLNDKLESEISKVQKFKNELIKSLGDKDEEGNISIPMRINETYNEDGSLNTWEINPKFIEYNKELDKLMQEEIELDFNEVSIEDMNVETEVNPKILFKIINQ